MIKNLQRIKIEKIDHRVQDQEIDVIDLEVDIEEIAQEVMNVDVVQLLKDEDQLIKLLKQKN